MRIQERDRADRGLLQTLRGLLSAALSVLLAIAVALAVPAVPLDGGNRAFAVTSAELRAQREALVEELASAQNELDEASDRYASVLEEQRAAEELAAKAAEEVEERRGEAERVREKLAVRISDMYKNDRSSIFVDLILGASSLTEMLSNWNMLSSINDNDANTINQSKLLRSEIAMKQLEAEEAEVLARSKAEEAEIIKGNAEAKAAELQRKVDGIDADIRAKVQEEAAIAAGKAAMPDKAAIAGAAAGIPTNGDVVDYAMSRLGCPYVWAAAGPNSFDCSGLVMWCYAKTGKRVPHNSEALKRAAKAVIPVSEAQPGDVLYRKGHVGICIESGGVRYIHAPSRGDVVKVASGGRWSAALRF